MHLFLSFTNIAYGDLKSHKDVFVLLTFSDELKHISNTRGNTTLGYWGMA